MNRPAYRIDGAAVSAEAFYAAACDPQRSVVVEACAGAGKTWMLVSRIVRALLDGTEPQQILAITFTRKAAGEMRQRLDEWLARFADPATGHDERVQALRERGLDDARAAALAPALASLQRRLIDGGRAVEIRTFHGWFAQLLAHAPWPLLDELGLPPRAELVEDPSALRLSLMRRFHRRVADDPALRADYAALVRERRRGTVRDWLDAAWARSAELDGAIAAGTLDDAVPAAATRWPACTGLDDPGGLVLREPLRTTLEVLAIALGQGGKLAQTAANGLRDALAESEPGAAFDGAWRALFTAKGEPRKLGAVPGLAEATDALSEVASMRRQQQGHVDHRRMAALSRVLLAEYAALKRERGVADMADLERAALAMLGDSAVAGWVQERLDQRLRQLLIDEFQDTSPLQWQALHGWLSSYAGAGGGAPAVFIVGDPKQSIYRFRRAEPRVFEAARRFVAQGLAGRVLECDHTRRNGRAVLGALNAVFGAAARDDGWVPFRDHTTGSAVAGAVLALPGVAREARPKPASEGRWRDSLTEPRREPEAMRRAEEASAIADGVAALLAEGVAPGEVMVLARRRSVLAVVADALARRGVPHVAPENLDLAASPEGLDLAALLDVLASPGHDLSLARALKSPLFGAGDDDLLWLARTARAAGRGWLETLLAAETPPGDALPRAARLLGDWRHAATVLPPHDLIDRIAHEGELMPRLAAVVPPARRLSARQGVQGLLAAALALDGGRYPGIYGFVRALRAGLLAAPPAAPADAVRLLTVHGAKGLEARAVFVADADAEAPKPARATLLVDWPVENRAPRGLAFVASEARIAPSLAALLADEVAARGREEINALYVAMTRAQERLVFAHSDPHQPDPRSWWRRVEREATEWAPPPTALPGATAPSEIDELPALLRVPAAPVAPAAVAIDGAQDADAARLGQAVHRALEWLSRAGAGLARAPACQAAAEAFGCEAGAVSAVVASILDAADCARFFAGPALRWAGNEVALADAEGVLRIDRLVRLDEDGGAVWWVLDYKLSPHPERWPEYRAQIARYVAAVARVVDDGTPVRGGFITGHGRFVPA